MNNSHQRFFYFSRFLICDCKNYTFRQTQYSIWQKSRESRMFFVSTCHFQFLHNSLIIFRAYVILRAILVYNISQFDVHDNARKCYVNWSKNVNVAIIVLTRVEKVNKIAFVDCLSRDHIFASLIRLECLRKNNINESIKVESFQESNNQCFDYISKCDKL